METPGTTIGESRAALLLADRYRLTRRIGRGGSADVFAGVDDLLGRPVAVKLFRADVPAGGGIRRVEAEMRMVAGLRHPGLVTVYDAGLTRDDPAVAPGEPAAGVSHLSGDAASASPFLVMELIEGVSLRQRLAQGAMTPGEAAEVGRSVAGTLAYIHAMGVVHRDVKPANVLLDQHAADPRYPAKLADFGIARLADSTHMTADGATLGTANYLSPEQVLGTEVGPASDVYALGLVLLECLTGRTAYDGAGIEVALARLRRAPTMPDGLERGWRELLTAMTTRDPRARPSAEQVERRLADTVTAGSVAPMWSDDVAATTDPADDAAITDLLLGAESDTVGLSAEDDELARAAEADRRGRRPRRLLAFAGGGLAAAALAAGLALMSQPSGSGAPPRPAGVTRGTALGSDGSPSASHVPAHERRSPRAAEITHAAAPARHRAHTTAPTGSAGPTRPSGRTGRAGRNLGHSRPAPGPPPAQHGHPPAHGYGWGEAKNGQHPGKHGHGPGKNSSGG